MGGTLSNTREYTPCYGPPQNQIDHTLINRKWRTSLQDFGVRKGPDVNSDHYLVIRKIKLKLRHPKVRSEREEFDVKKLTDKNVRRNFSLKLRDRFAD